VSSTEIIGIGAQGGARSAIADRCQFEHAPPAAVSPPKAAATAAPPIPKQTITPAPDRSRSLSRWFDSAIVSGFSMIFTKFRRKRFSLLWLCDRDFHGRANTLSLIEDAELEWDEREREQLVEGRYESEEFLFPLCEFAQR
jgi:hypothetical protein